MVITKINKIYIGIGIVVIILLMLTGYFRDKVIVALGGYTDKDSVTTVETKYIKGKVDTLAIFNHYVATKGIVLNPKAKIVYRYKNPLINIGVVDSLKEFTVQIKDSLIDGKLVVLNKFNGDLKDAHLTYKPLFPKYIRRTDTIYTTIHTTNTLTNKRALLGLGAGYSNLQYFSLLGSYTTKSKWQFIYEYGKPLVKTKEVINGLPIQFATDDLHSVKVIKHF